MFERLSDAQKVQSGLVPSEVALLQRAVQAAGISEFDFFRAAWHAWHASPPNEKHLEQIFVGYLFHEKVPVFARHFARRILDAQADGALDTAALGLDSLKPVQRPRYYVHPIEDVTAFAMLALCVLPFV